MKSGPDIVVGSGPSGVAVATALVARGRRVLMLDAGERMEAESAALRERLGATPPDGWTDEDRAASGARRRSEKSDSIRPFGSDFLFRVPAGAGRWDASGVHALRPSFAPGGLSNGWGASVLPYTAGDLADWPVGADEMAPHYREAAKLAGAARSGDGLSALFGDPAAGDHSLPVTRQAARLLDRMESKKAALDRLGVHYGRSRQAIAPGCHACGQCLYGCPYGLIFNAGDVAGRMAGEGAIEHRQGVVVKAFAESADGVVVQTDRGPVEGARLFLGAGVLPTARIMLESLGWRDRPVTLLDSQHFYLPMLHGWSSGGDPAGEARHTLAQVFWEIDDPAVDGHVVHAQLYTYNENYASDMRQRFGALASVAKPLIETMSRRLIVAQTFLHSDVSPAIELRLAGDELAYRRIDNDRAADARASAARRIARIARLSGMVPLTPLLRPGELGSSFHCGGSFPMRREADEGECDTLGRPKGFSRVHIVDASVFPTVPAPTITLSVMANAHRIGSAA